MDHQGRRGDLVEPPVRRLTLLGQGVVHHAGLLTRADAGLRTIHLGEPAPQRDGPSVMKRLAEAYAAAL